MRKTAHVIFEGCLQKIAVIFLHISFLQNSFFETPFVLSLHSFCVKFFLSDLVCLVLIFQISINHTVIHRVVQGGGVDNIYILHIPGDPKKSTSFLEVNINILDP